MLFRVLLLVLFTTANVHPILHTERASIRRDPRRGSGARPTLPTAAFIFHLLKHKFSYPLVEKIPTPTPTANCICVPYYQCNSNNTIITDGSGIVDVRFLTVTFRRCTGDLEVCCKPPPASMAPIVTPMGTTTPMPTVPSTVMSTMPTTMMPTPPPTTATTTTQPPPTSPPTTTSTQPPTTMPTTPPTTMPPTTTTTTTQAPAQLCICVPIAQCDASGFVIIGGEGVINPRQTMNPCPTPGEICCRVPSSTQPPPPPPPPPPVVTDPPFTVSPSMTLPTVSCVCVQLYQCDPNGYIVVSGAGNIDPRFPIGRQGQVAGTCVSLTEICCRIFQSGNQDSVIGFPSVVIPTNAVTTSVVRNPGTVRACACVKSWLCAEGNVVALDGAGIIDPRFGACPNADEICCRLQGITRSLPAGGLALGNVFIVTTNTALKATAPSSGVCGVRTTTCTSAEACAIKPGETSFAEFPWMVALLIRKPDDTALQFLCGASVINTRSVLTATHCVLDRPAGTLIARFGEWNTADNTEPVPFQEADIQTVITHPLYYKGGLYNDVAVLILATPITYALNVMPVCLPSQGMTFAPGTLCWASGWGRNAFEGRYQVVLRKIDLPIVDRADCQTRLRSTRLGQYFQLHGSFICAGGEPNKDTCRGDGGGPLVCPTATGQFVQSGIVSWGIGCGESNTPAVYASVAQFRHWIDQQLANYGVL